MKYIKQIVSLVMITILISVLGNIENVSADSINVNDFTIWVPADDDSGLLPTTPSGKYKYSGLSETMAVGVYSKDEDKKESPNVSVVPGADSVKYKWSVSNDNKVIKIDKEDEYKATILRVGPGSATVTCEITWLKGTSVQKAINLTTTIIIPIEVDKKTTNDDSDIDYGRDKFTKSTKKADVDDKGNTFLMLKGDQAEVNQGDVGKTIRLKYNTKSTKDSVKWETSIERVAEISYANDGQPINGVQFQKIKIVGKEAGCSTIRAEAFTNKEVFDTFYAVVMPTFKVKDKEYKVYPLEGMKNGVLVEYLKDMDVTKITEIVGRMGESFTTNAVETNKLNVDVRHLTNKGLEPIDGKLKVITGGNSNIRIDMYSKPGVYRMTAQTKVPNMVLDPDLGAAAMFFKVAIEVSQTDFVMGIGDSLKIEDIINVHDVTDFTYTPSQEKICSYHNGVITGEQQGLVEYKIKLKNEENILAKYGIKEKTPDYEKYVTNGIKIQISVVDAFSINNSEVILPIKGTATLEVSTKSNEPIEWVMKDENIAVIKSGENSKKCTIEAVKEGVTYIEVSQTVNGIRKVAKCKIIVEKSVEKIKIEPDYIELNEGGNPVPVEAKITPSNLVTGNLKWSSSNPEIVSVEGDGKKAVLKGLKAGSAIITVISTDNAVMGTARVTVFGKASGMEILPKDQTFDISKKNVQMSVELKPAVEIKPKIGWLSSDEDIATIDKNGLVTLKKSGKVTITAFIESDPKIKATTTLTITKGVEGIKFKEPSKLMYVGESYKLEYSIKPEDAKNQKVLFKSSNTSVVTITPTGEAKALAPGEATIVAQTEDGNYVDFMTIFVKMKAQGIELLDKEIILDIKEEKQIKYKILPDGATDIKLNWNTLNSNIVTVSQDGKVTGLDVGETTVFVTTPSGETAYIKVKVVRKKTGIKLNYKKKIIGKGKSFTLKASILPDGAVDKNVKFVSDDTSIATVSSKGVVKGKKVGSTLITAYTSDGEFSASCLVQVSTNKESIKVETYKNLVYVEVGKKKTLKITYDGKTKIDYKKFKFTTSNKKIATVSSKGVVKGVKKGKVTITIKATDGTGSYKKVNVKVVKYPTKIKATKQRMIVTVGPTYKLPVSVYPKDSSFKSLKYKSADEKIVRVYSDGTFNGLELGTTYVTVTVSGGGKTVSKKIYIDVKEETRANKVTITTKDLVLISGEKYKLSATITPYNATDKVKFISENEGVATITSSGTITARQPGEANILAVTSNGKIDNMTLNVIGLDVYNLVLPQYSTNKINVIGNAKGVYWYTSDPTIVKVENGNITTLKPGKANVIAVVSGKRITCKVYVTGV